MLKQTTYSKIIDVNDYLKFPYEGFIVKKVAVNFRLFIIKI